MATPHTAADDLEKGISNVPNSPPIATNDDPINVFSPVTSHSDTQATLTNGINLPFPWLNILNMLK